MSIRVVHALVVLGVAGLAALAGPVAARADDDGDGDVRVEPRCTLRSTVELRVRARDDDRLRVEVEVRTSRRGARWVVIVIHERRLVARLPVRTGPRSRSFSLRRTIADWPGRDTVVVRAIGPRGEICRAAVAVEEQASD